jgi:hypothetical protein
VSPLPQNCTQEALPPRFFKHIRPEQASSPSFFGEQLAEELSELSSNEEGDDAMSGTACRAFNPQKPGTPVGRAQDGFVTPTTHPEDELLGLLEGGSPEHNPQRSPSGLEKVLAALKFEDDSD